LAVQPGGDVRDVGRGERELRHPDGGDAVLHDRGDRLAVLIAQYHRVPDEVRALLPAARIRAVAEAAVTAKQLLAVRQLLGRSGRVLGVVGRAIGGGRGSRCRTWWSLFRSLLRNERRRAGSDQKTVKRQSHRWNPHGADRCKVRSASPWGKSR